MPTHREVHVLLVEDNPVDVEAVQRSFKARRIGNPIHVARDGILGLEALRNGTVPRPYVILLDLNLPRMNGLEFLDAIRNDDDLSDSVVFVLTTSDLDRDRAAAYANHVAGYILKQDVGSGFLGLVDMLERYWKVVTLPDGEGP